MLSLLLAVSLWFDGAYYSLSDCRGLSMWNYPAGTEWSVALQTGDRMHVSGHVQFFDPYTRELIIDLSDAEYISSGVTVYRYRMITDSIIEVCDPNYPLYLPITFGGL